MTTTRRSDATSQKYAPHPDRAGYLFVATDLETVLFEALTATAIPTRLSDVATRLNDFDAPEAGSLSLEDEQRQSEETLQGLAEMFDGSLSGASISAERDDYYDLVLVVRSPSLNWQFNLTYVRPSFCADTQGDARKTAVDLPRATDSGAICLSHRRGPRRAGHRHACRSS